MIARRLLVLPVPSTMLTSARDLFSSFRIPRHAACRRGFLFVLLTIMPVVSLYAQEYNFRNISVADGLAQSQVYTMCQDRRGVIWFGTRGGGVSCYDGVSFTTLTEEEGLPSNYVRTVLVDRAGAVWIGTDQGLVRYNGRSFTPFTQAGSIGRRVVNALALDSSGALWAGSEHGGLWRYDGRGFTSIPQDGSGIIRVRCLSTDMRGRIWIGTDRGVRVRDAKPLQIPPAGNLPGQPVTAIVHDRDGSGWIGTYGGGIVRSDDTTSTLFTVNHGLSNNTVTSLLIDRAGRLWIGTAGGGVCRRDGNNFTIFTETEGLCNNVVMSLMEDAEGNIWIGSSGGGVSRFDGERFTHFTERQGKIGNWVYAIQEDREGAIWIGNSSGGVTRYDGINYERFTGRQGLTSGKVKCIFQDSRGVLWLGTVGDGLYTRENGVFRRFVWKAGTGARFINAVAEDRDGTIWLASSDAGVIGIKRAGDDSTSRFVQVGMGNGLGSDRAYYVHAADNGTIWVATDGAGIACIRPRNGAAPLVTRYTTEQGLGSNTIRSIARDRKGNLLFGTGGGGIILHDGTSFRNIGRKEGLRSNNIYALVVDNAGQVWLGTEKGIDRIEIDTAFQAHELKHYGRAEGIRGIEISQNAACVDGRGNIWFGTIRGAVRYNPREDRPNTAPPRTHLKGIRLFSHPIETTAYGDSLLPWYPVPRALELPYDQNHLSFDVVGISHRNPEAVTYQWLLEGFDDEWSPQTLEGTAIYSNLPPGSYTFRVRSYNEDGLADSSSSGFRFTIHPPFWETWWFRAAVVIVVASGVGIAFRARLAKVRREGERQRHELELQRSIVELEQKSLRLSMNPHFIFNALNSIQSFIADRETHTARAYLTKFARLMRLILENSRSEYVPVEDEAAMLGNYLELERLNLGGTFRYEVVIDPGLDAGAIFIPPMLIQPLVENAVVHGMRCGNGDGLIRVELALAGDLVHCIVTDNGIGRRQAATLRNNSNGRHASTALSVIRERLEIMSRDGGPAARLEITDLHDTHGTRCALFIPYTRE